MTLNDLLVPLIGFPFYEISKSGKIFNALKNFFPRITLDKKHNYYVVGLNKYDPITKQTLKTSVYKLHRLLGAQFLDNPNNCKFISHIDNNPQNNDLNNLFFTNTQFKTFSFIDGVYNEF